MRILLLISLISLCASNSLAQQTRVLPIDALKTRSTDATGPVIRDATLELVNSDEGQASLANYRALRSAGVLPRAAKSSSYTIGERKFFEMRDLSAPSNQIKYDDLEYELRAVAPGLFNIWVQVSELANGHVLPQDVEDMRVALGESTSSDSYRPDLGVVEINTTVFGPAPDVDGDGILDVLVGDIQDGFDHVTQSGPIVLGFFDPVNLTLRNRADIIYLDSYPGIVNIDGVRNPFDPPAQTLAHEEQHLIFATANQAGDLSFVNEGLSEWAEILCGFTARPISYFQSEIERRHALLDFRDLGDNAFDYQRAGLWTNYLAERIGVLNTGAVARSPGIGAYGYYDVVNGSGLSLPQILQDFHVANLLNDRSIAEAFGYETPQRRSIQVTNIPVVDGTSASSTSPISGVVNPGGVHYMTWSNVRNLYVSVTETNGIPELLAPVLVAEPEVGPVQIFPFNTGGEGTFLSGSFLRVTLVLPHVYLWDPNQFSSAAPSAAYSYHSNWAEFQSVLSTTAYDDGMAALLTVGASQFNALYLEPAGQKANRFEVPAGSMLTYVQIDQPYEHDFLDSTVPETAPRDFTLVVWDEDPDGRPGNELFTLDVTDNSLTGFEQFIFHTVDLRPYAAQLSNLPPVIFVGTRNAGSDLNYLLMTVSAYPGGNSPSFMYDSFFASDGISSPWESFSNFCIGTCDEVDMDKFVAPIRATFAPAAGPTAIDDDGVLPERISLEQNYPNPFNPATAIRFSLPSTQRVSLKVFDVLGREVQTLVDGFETVGEHEIRFDAGRLSSGVYIYALQTETEFYSRTMTLLK